jgi:predicted glycoside hydrolase/deacetylase ChbG (UPF0249 family)
MNQTIQLIINADDLGAGEPTDRGIFEAFNTGIVNSASLLANGPSFESAATLALETNLPVGVHLNLSEGYALTGAIEGLTDSEGRFFGKQESRKRFVDNSISADSVQNELLAQIEKVKQAGLKPDHLDTHQHCGLFPVITSSLVRIAKTTGILRMRLPNPVCPSSEDPPPPLGDELRLYRHLAPQVKEQFRSAGLTTPDGLLGMPLLDRIDENNLSKLLSNLNPGSWELMVHPGYFDPLNAFAGRKRELELTALTSSKILKLVQQCQIRLINFSELRCAY